MDLDKDNKDIYTIDSENYSEYMQEDKKEPRDLLSTVIQFLIVILLIVLVYFFFNILKNDLTFSEVFNKKELLATYESLTDSDEEIHIEQENNAEVLPKKIAMVVEQDKFVAKKVEQKEEPKVAVPVSMVVAKETKPIIKVESKPMVKENKVEEVIAVEKIVVVNEEPKPLKTIEKVEAKKIVEAEPVEVIENLEVPEESELTESYLDRMVAELNSEI